MEKKKKKRLSALDIVLYCISGALLIGGIILIVRQYVLIPGHYEAPPTPTPTVTPVATPSPSSGLTVITPEPEQTAEPTPAPYEYTRSVPTKIYFLDAQVSVEVQSVGIIEEGDHKGQMGTIDDPDVAAWYEPGYAPGELGNALINGHKSWKGKIGRFSVLWDMKTGQQVAVEREDGSVLYFMVVSVDFYPYNDYPESVMEMESDTAKLTLITCYGDFDRQAGTSEQRCVVVCELITD